jgi:hypothetical protein
MDLRLDLVETAAGPLLQIAGCLDGARVGTLLDYYRQRQDRPPLSIAQLVSADEAGVAVLCYLDATGIRITDASPYFEYLLKTSVG